MRALILGLLCLPTPALAEPTHDPAEVMAKIMAVLTSPDQAPEDVLRGFLPGITPADWTISTTDGLPENLNDAQALIFTATRLGQDPMGWDSISVTCLRFGPETLAFAQQDTAPIIGPMLLKTIGSGGWAGNIVLDDLPELGQTGQVFPQGAILRQDCAIRYGFPSDYPFKALNDWPKAALIAIEAQFSTVTTAVLPPETPNPHISFRAADPKVHYPIQVMLMLGTLPYRPFDDLHMPPFELAVRATTYLYAPGS